MSQDKIYKIIGYSLEIIISLLIGIPLISIIFILAGQPINWIAVISLSNLFWIFRGIDIKVGPQAK